MILACNRHSRLVGNGDGRALVGCRCVQRSHGRAIAGSCSSESVHALLRGYMHTLVSRYRLSQLINLLTTAHEKRPLRREKLLMMAELRGVLTYGVYAQERQA